MIRFLSRCARRLRRPCSSLKAPEDLLLLELDRLELDSEGQARQSKNLPAKALIEQAKIPESREEEIPAEVQQVYRRVNSIRTEQGLQSFFEENKESLDPFLLTLIFKKLFDVFQLAKRAGDRDSLQQFLQRDTVRPIFQLVVGNFKQLPPYYLAEVVDKLVKNRLAAPSFFRDLEQHLVSQLFGIYQLQEDKVFRTLALMVEAGHVTSFDADSLLLIAERALSSGTFDSPDRFVRLFFHYHMAVSKLCKAGSQQIEAVQLADFSRPFAQLLPKLEIKHATILLNALAASGADKDSHMARKLNEVVRTGQRTGNSSRRLAELLEIVARD